MPHEHSSCRGGCDFCDFCDECDFCEETYQTALSWTALHGAVALGRKEMTQLLLSKGADTSSKLRLFDFYGEPPNPRPLVEPHTHEVTAMQISRVHQEDQNPRISIWGISDSLEKSGYPYLGYPGEQLLQRNLRGVEEILMQNCANEAERNIGMPVCDRRRRPCFHNGVTWVPLPALLWVFQDFPKRMDHSANERCPLQGFNIQ